MNPSGKGSRRTRPFAPLSLVAAGMVALSLPASAATTQPVVVELFTSQGCSSCPPANANAAAISQRPGVLVLSYGVTYWDYLGWKDIFAKPEFTLRQRTYEPALGKDGPFTPQIVVNGRKDIVGNRRPELDALVASSQPVGTPAVTLAAGRAAIGAGPAPATPADIWLVHYDPRTIEVQVRRGENGGHTLPHKNVVRDIARIGGWQGGETSIGLPPAAPGLKTAILVQTPDGGPILAAATD